MAHRLQIYLLPNLASKQADWNMYAEMKIKEKLISWACSLTTIHLKKRITKKKK